MGDVTDMYGMFQDSRNLKKIVLPKIDMTKVSRFGNMFHGCESLTHIKCYQSFKDWCLANQTTIRLPTSMCAGGDGTWEIVT